MSDLAARGANGRGNTSAGWRRRVPLIGAGLTVLVGLMGASSIAWREYRQGLGPLDLSTLSERSTTVVDRSGRLLRPYTTADGRWRLPARVEAVDPRFLTMLKAYEDGRFDTHAGVDPWAALRAAGQAAWNGRVVSGASTLTMQVARLLEPRDERTLAAKARQIARALDLERAYSKRDILNIYLDLAPYGGNLEGVRAASFAYFGKEPQRLTTAEAALLVALPQSPETRRPDRFPERAREARDRVLDRLVGLGVVDPEDAILAKAEPVPTGRIAFPMLAAHAADAAVARDPTQRDVVLTIDAPLQVAIETLVRDRVPKLGDKVSAAILVVDNATGAIRTHVGGYGFLDEPRAGSLDLTEALRSPGSTLKPFVYGLAFESGLAHPETLLDDRPSRFGAWSPENFDERFQGTVTARTALQMSLNVPAVDLLAELGPARLIGRLRGAGALIALPREAAPGLAIGLGGLGTRLVDLASLYAALARGGETIALTTSLADITAPTVPVTRRILDPVAAFYVADVLRGAPPPPNAMTGRIAFKTGTSYGYRDAWAIGFDRETTVAVWVGRPDGAPVPGLLGRTVAAPLVFDVFARLGREPVPVNRPDGVLTATTSSLPPPLRHIRALEPKTLAAGLKPPLRVAFPPDGARVDVGLSDPAGAMPLALKAQGGTLPLTFLVNGQRVSTAGPRRSAQWVPDGAGFAEISVIDADGETARVTVRIE